jgi:hypothetical protein
MAMRRLWTAGLILLAGCELLQKLPDEPATQQVRTDPFAEPRRVLPRVQAQPASQESAYRVELIRSKLVGENPQAGLRPNVMAVNAADPEIFHTDLNNIYITEGLIRQCQSDGQLAGVLAFALGRMVSEREAAVDDKVRQPDRLMPIHVPIGGGGNARLADPLNEIELARFEKQYPKHKKLSRPNPHLVARTILERAGYQTTELDAALPILSNAERYAILENQFNGIAKQSEWK